MTTMTPEVIADSIRALIVANETNLGTDVTVPVVYADGEIVSVIVAPAGGGFLVHDSGSGIARVVATGRKLTETSAIQLKDLARRFRCSLVDGRVVARAEAARLAAVACLVANASRAVADYGGIGFQRDGLEFRQSVIGKMRDALGERVRENGVVRGRSGMVHHVHAVVLDAGFAYPIHFLAMLAHRDGVGDIFAMFHDLGGAFPDISRSAIFDESGDVTPEDLALLRQVGSVVGVMETPLLVRKLAGRAARSGPHRLAAVIAGE